jgi:prophage DNA circulation protein
MSISEAVRAWLLQPVLDKLRHMEAIMAADQAALDAAIKTLSDTATALFAAVTAEDTGLAAGIAALKAIVDKLVAGASPTDLANEITALSSLSDGLSSTSSDLVAQTKTLADAVAAAKSATGT